MSYSVRHTGRPNTLEYRLFLEKDGAPISSWHDIPLYANKEQQIFNMVVEIPRWTNAKYEIARNEALNPIKQDVKDGKIRFTWEDPAHVHPDTQHQGDNDPLDACEIGQYVATPGEVKQVKALGAMALLDDGETDWKIIVIDVHDPLAQKLHDINDVEEHFPGLLDSTRDWFRTYKIPDGKKPNKFALNGEFKNKEYALSIIRECSEAWDRLIGGKADPGKISLARGKDVDKVPPPQDLQPAPMDRDLDKWFFLGKL